MGLVMKKDKSINPLMARKILSLRFDDLIK